MSIDDRVSPQDIARVTDLDEQICRLWLEAVKRHPWWGDQLVNPYPLGDGIWAAAAQLGDHWIELSRYNLPAAEDFIPRLACFVPHRHEDWTFGVAGDAELIAVPPAGLTMVIAPHRVEQVLADLLSPVFADRFDRFQVVVRRTRGTVLRMEDIYRH